MNIDNIIKTSEVKTVPSLAIIIPCHNESDAFSRCISTLTNILNDLIINQKILANSYLLFVDDGSHDNTWQLIEQAAASNSYVKGIKLSRNYGHQIALLAGLSMVDTDINISIDGESKYPLRKMLALAIEGITSLTVTPLRIITVLGILIFLLALIACIYKNFKKVS